MRSSKLAKIRISAEGYSPVTIKTMTSDGGTMEWPNENSFEIDSQGNTIPSEHPALDLCNLTIPLSATTPASTINALQLIYEAASKGVLVTAEVETAGSFGFNYASNNVFFITKPRPDSFGKIDGAAVRELKLRCDKMIEGELSALGRVVDVAQKLVSL